MPVVDVVVGVVVVAAAVVVWCVVSSGVVVGVGVDRKKKKSPVYKCSASDMCGSLNCLACMHA